MLQNTTLIKTNLIKEDMMGKTVLTVLIGIMLMAGAAFAADGDLIVDGNLGIGTATAPLIPLHIISTTVPQFILENSSTTTPNARMDIRRGASTGVVQLLFGTGTNMEYQVGEFNNENFQIRVVNDGKKSITLTSTGYVGIGTETPVSRLSVTDEATAPNRGIIVSQHTSDAASAALILRKSRNTEAAPAAVSTGDYISTVQFRGYDGSNFLRNAAIGARVSGTVSAGSIPHDIYFASSATDMSDSYAEGKVRMIITSNGKVGIGTTTPLYALHVCGPSGTPCAYNEGGTAWINASSREYKENIRHLSAESAMETLRGLNPVTFTYKTVPGQNHVGFIAEDVPDLVAMKDRKGLSPLDIVAVLTKTVQVQQKTIEDQQKNMEHLNEKLSVLERMVDRLTGSNMVSSAAQ